MKKGTFVSIIVISTIMMLPVLAISLQLIKIVSWMRWEHIFERPEYPERYQWYFKLANSMANSIGLVYTDCLLHFMVGASIIAILAGTAMVVAAITNKD